MRIGPRTEKPKSGAPITVDSTETAYNLLKSLPGEWSLMDEATFAKPGIHSEGVRALKSPSIEEGSAEDIAARASFKKLMVERHVHIVSETKDTPRTIHFEIVNPRIIQDITKHLMPDHPINLLSPEQAEDVLRIAGSAFGQHSAAALAAATQEILGAKASAAR